MGVPLVPRVTVSTYTVSQSFGSAAVLISARGRVLARTGVRPFGFTGTVLQDARAIIAQRGWREVA